MKATLLNTSLILATGFLVSCENPADKTTDAEVGAAKSKVTESGPDNAVKYTFTPNSSIGFEGSKVTGSHKGGFKTFTGHFTIADGQPVGNDHKVEIEMNSIWSDNEKLTGHLKAPDFFDVATYATTTFDVTGIENKSATEFIITGNLDMHGVSKSVTFPATVAREGDTVRIKATFDINRFDWNMEFKGKPDDLIRKEVVLTLDLEARPGN